MEPDQTPPAERERLFNIPWPVTALIGVLLAVFAVQAFLGVGEMVSVWGFRPTDFREGNYLTLVASLFLHGYWLHFAVNALFLVIFGSPVARRMGEGLRGALSFYAFYIVCGIGANLAYAILNPGGDNPTVGASGAIAGLMGAASRLIRRAPGESIAPILSNYVIGLTVAWTVLNLVFGVLLRVWWPVWQLHLAGFALGLFLLAPALRLVGRR